MKLMLKTLQLSSALYKQAENKQLLVDNDVNVTSFEKV